MTEQTKTTTTKKPRKTSKTRRRKSPMVGKIKKMILAGASNKEIIATLKCHPQTVYNTRYYVNKTKGLGALEVKDVKEANISILGGYWEQTDGVAIDCTFDPTVKELKPSLWQRFVRWFKEKTND